MKTRVIKIVFCLSVIVVGAALFWRCKSEDKTTCIVEIQNTKESYDDPNTKYHVVNMYYMILNPPDDLQKLKAVVDTYLHHNSFQQGLPKKEKRDRYITVLFYRESNHFHRGWQPRDDYFNMDRIEDHGDDCIAMVDWTDGDLEKHYYIDKKSRDRNDYGTILEEVN